VVAEGVVELNHAEEFTQGDDPIRGIVVGVLGRTVLVRAYSGHVAVFGVGWLVGAMQGERVVELDYPEDFCEVDEEVAIDIGAVNSVLVFAVCCAFTVRRALVRSTTARGVGGAGFRI